MKRGSGPSVSEMALLALLVLLPAAGSADAMHQAAASGCQRYSGASYRLAALGGLFPVPAYLSLNPLPGQSKPWTEVSLTRITNGSDGGVRGAIAFARVSYVAANGSRPSPLSAVVGRSSTWSNLGVTVEAFPVERSGVVGGVDLNSGVVISGFNTQIEIYGDKVQFEAIELVNLFLGDSGGCLAWNSDAQEIVESRSTWWNEDTQ